MSKALELERSWLETIRLFFQPKMAMMLLLGFTAGLPFLLYFSTLSVRLEKNGVDASIIGFFSWFGLAYALKFLWAPFVDRFKPFGLEKTFGQRASWIFVAQIGVALGLVGLGLTDPKANLSILALFSLLVAFSSATQDIGIDAWRIEVADGEDEHAPLAMAYNYGYRVALMVSGGVALTIAGFVNWSIAYLVMAGLIGIAAIILLIWGSRKSGLSLVTRTLKALPAFPFAALFFGAFLLICGGLGWVAQTIATAAGLELSRGMIRWLATSVAALPFIICIFLTPYIRSLPSGHNQLISPVTGPIFNFFWRYGWAAVLILAFISSYRLSDIVMGVMAKASYSHVGFSEEQIGLVSGFYGPWILIAGVALAGIMALRFGLTICLVTGAVISVVGNLTFVWLMGQSPDTMVPLFVAISADNIAGGFAGTIFIAYMSGLTNRAFTASQYALFSSMFLLLPKILAGTSGIIVDEQGYASFFLYAASLGVPAIILSFLVVGIRPDRSDDQEPKPIAA